MTKYILAAALSLSLCAQAAPFLVSEVDPNADTCLFTPAGAAAPIVLPVVVDNVRGIAANNFRICKLDLAGVATGNIIEVTRNTVWGVASAPVNFLFAPVTTLGAQTGSRIVP